MTQKPETKIVNKIKIYLKSMPKCWHFKTHGGLYQTLGLPDIIGCINGNFFAIEVKTADGKVSKLQEKVILEIIKSGGIAFVARSIEDVKNNLKTYDVNNKV